MKSLEKSDKDAIKLQFAVALRKILDNSEVKTLKKLAREADMEPSHIQKIAAGKVDVALTTSITLSRAFGISYAELAATYESITDEDIDGFLQKQEILKKHKGKPKLPLVSTLLKIKGKKRS